MPNSYEVGTRVRCSMTFYSNPDDITTVADPDTVTFRFKSPLGVVTQYVYPTDIQLVKDSTGVYHVNVTPDVDTEWEYSFKGTGVIAVVKQGRFTATRTIFQD